MVFDHQSIQRRTRDLRRVSKRWNSERIHEDLYCWSLFASTDGNIRRLHLSWTFPVFAWLLFCPRFFTCGMFNAKLCEKYDIFLVLSCLASSPFTAPLFFAWSFTSNLVPNTPTSVPPPHVFPAPVVARAAFHFDCFCSVPPLRTSPLKCVFQCCQNRTWLWITSPSHGSPHAF